MKGITDYPTLDHNTCQRLCKQKKSSAQSVIVISARLNSTQSNRLNDMSAVTYRI